MEKCRDLLVELFSKEGLEHTVKGNEVAYGGMKIEFKPNELSDLKFGVWIQLAAMHSTYIHSHGDIASFADYLFDFLKNEKAQREAYRAADVAKYGLIPKEQADKAARWWADHLRGKNKKNRTELPLFGEILFKKLDSVLPPIDRRINRFESILSAKIQEEVARWGGVSLYVDYNPMGLLQEAWVESAPDDRDDGFGRFPVKTSMSVYKDKVELNGKTEYVNGQYVTHTTPV